MKTTKFYFILSMLMMLLPLLTKAQDKGINSVLTAYFAVKNDLTVDNYTLAKTHSADLTAAIKTVPADKISIGQQAAWKKIQLSTTRIGEAKDIDTQRDYFAILSENLIVVAKALKASGLSVYQQYCPMKKVNWLSEVASIKNPYYGKQMSTCGNTVETLAAVK